jgi:acyl dehydratase
MSDCRAVRWDEIQPGHQHRLAFAISPADMTGFAAVSGDHNPLHHDPAFAGAKGFAGVVVYGGLLVAQISRMIGMIVPGRDAVWTGLSIEFRNPLLVGEPAVLIAEIVGKSESTRQVRLKIAIQAGERIIALGKADALHKD